MVACDGADLPTAQISARAEAEVVYHGRGSVDRHRGSDYLAVMSTSRSTKPLPVKILNNSQGFMGNRSAVTSDLSVCIYNSPGHVQIAFCRAHKLPVTETHQTEINRE